MSSHQHSNASPPLGSPNVLHVSINEDALKHLIAFMDFKSIDAFISAFHDNPIIREGILKDSNFWEDMLLLLFQDHMPMQLDGWPKNPRTSVHRNWDWTCTSKNCRYAMDFFRSGDDLQHFKQTVHVVRGDLGSITHIGDCEIDGIAFPTNSYLANALAGASGAVYRRAGPELEAYVNSVSFRGNRNIGQVEVTPAFKAGARRLFHCVGPHVAHRNAFAMLVETYQNLMKAIVQEDVHCVAMGSISTGMLRMPVRQSAYIALQVVVMFLRENPNWHGKLGFVLYDRRLYDRFIELQTLAIDTFNAFSSSE